MPSIEMLKQLLDEFTEKEAHTAEEINVVTQQIGELEQRVEQSKLRLESIAKDRDKIYELRDRYADSNWQMPVAPQKSSAPAEKPAQAAASGAKMQIEGKGKPSTTSSKVKAAEPQPDANAKKAGRSGSPFIATPKPAVQPASLSLFTTSTAAPVQPAAPTPATPAAPAAKVEEMPAAKTSLFDLSPAQFGGTNESNYLERFGMQVTPEQPSPTPEPAPVVETPPVVLKDSNPLFRALASRSRTQMPPYVPPQAQPEPTPTEPPPAAPAQSSSNSVIDLGEDDESDGTDKSINAALRGLFR